MAHVPFSRHSYTGIILVLHVMNSVLVYDLDQNALEIDWQPSLELLCTHPHNFQALLVVNVRMVVLVE